MNCLSSQLEMRRGASHVARGPRGSFKYWFLRDLPVPLLTYPLPTHTKQGRRRPAQKTTGPDDDDDAFITPLGSFVRSEFGHNHRVDSFGNDDDIEVDVPPDGRAWRLQRI